MRNHDTMKKMEERRKWVIQKIKQCIDQGVGDPIEHVLYDSETNITLDYCPIWSYFEVFGLSNDEFDDVANYYYEKFPDPFRVN